MTDGIYTALSGALAQQQALDIVANNVANASTKGFRADRAVFMEVLASTSNSQPEQAKLRPEVGVSLQRGVKVGATAVDTSAGAFIRTGNPLDIALHGQGFFAIEGAAGIRYTRAGSFTVDSRGALLTSNGEPVIGEGGPISVGAGTPSLTIGEDGSIRANGQDVGKLQVVEFADPAKLTKAGLTQFSAPKGVVPLTTVSTTRVLQGHLESSNVNSVAGINELITVNRSFDALQRVIDTFHKLDERTARELGSRNG